MGMTLKAARINAGMTQKEAAQRIGVRVETLAKYEKGKTYPNIPVLKQIETIYGIEYKDLVFLPDNYPLRVKGSKNNLAM